MKSLLTMLRLFHLMVGITAPPREKERMYLLVWVGVLTGLVVLAVLCVWVIVPYVLR